MSSDSDPEMFPYDPDTDLDPFSYQDPFLTSVMSRAVLNNDIEQVRFLIESGKSVNCQDNNGNAPLHLAVASERAVILDLLLSCPEVNVDHKSFLGYTPLLLGLDKAVTGSYIMRLLEGNCSVHITNNMKQTALHLAVLKNYQENILCELIKRGADVNAQDSNNMTPLHHAAKYNHEAAVHVLLYYEADVSLFCSANMNAFMYAAESSYDITRILFDFYDDFSYISVDGYNSLLLAAKTENPIAVDLVRAGADVNCFVSKDLSILHYALWYSNAELFKEVWRRLDFQTIVYSKLSFLDIFIAECCFTNSDFLECLFLILNSSCVTDLINPPIYPDFHTIEDYSINVLIRTLHKRMIPKSPRLDIICITLSYGYKVHFEDIDATYELYGINEELELLIQAGYCNKQANCHCKSRTCPPLLAFILGIEEDCKNEQIFEIFKSEIYAYCFGNVKTVAKNNILYALRLFSIPYTEKQKLINLYSNHKIDEILEELTAAPELPSLTEICRNQARKFINQNHKIEQPYHFYDVLKRLNIPNIIKHILTFKKPLYIKS